MLAKQSLYALCAVGFFCASYDAALAFGQSPRGNPNMARTVHGGAFKIHTRGFIARSNINVSTRNVSTRTERGRRNVRPAGLNLSVGAAGGWYCIIWETVQGKWVCRLSEKRS